MKRSGIGSIELSEAMHRDNTQLVDSWITGKFLPNINNVIKLSEILNLTPNDIFNSVENTP